MRIIPRRGEKKIKTKIFDVLEKYREYRIAEDKWLSSLKFKSWWNPEDYMEKVRKVLEKAGKMMDGLEMISIDG